MSRIMQKRKIRDILLEWNSNDAAVKQLKARNIY